MNGLHKVCRVDLYECGVCGDQLEILRADDPWAEMMQLRCGRCNVVVQAQRQRGMLKIISVPKETVGATP